MTRTKIEWCDYTWNPVAGCTGSCPYCYARKMAHRFHRDFTPHWVERNFERKFPHDPSMIFVNSMSDVAEWDDKWSLRVFKRIEENPEHLFLFLTKRSEKLGWYNRPSNVLLGASVTDQESYMAESFQVAEGTIQFLSVEPLLGEIDMGEMTCGQVIRWIIVGAETGNRKGRVIPKYEWLKNIAAFCYSNNIPLFFKESLRNIWNERGEYFPQEYPK